MVIPKTFFTYIKTRPPLLLFLAIFLFPTTAHATWFYPLTNTLSRNSLKQFNQYISSSFYLGKESLFPSKFVGYHVGVDWEIFPDELNTSVPVYAVGSGVISYSGPVSGYGKLILEKLADAPNKTALYGHIVPLDSVKVGSKVLAGQQLGILGKAFSTQTGGERKHLHFAIYNGTDLYFRGYESSSTTVSNRWINPLEFLSQNSATDISPNSPTPSPSPVPTPTSTPAFVAKPTGIFGLLVSFFNHLLKQLHIAR